jgi:hypothetical protein
MADTASPRWVPRLLSEIDAADTQATALAGGLSAEQLNWRASQAEWSIGQCLEHLAVTNEVYGSAIGEALNGARPAVAQEITPGWFGRWFIRSYIDPATQKIKGKAPSKIVPVATVDAGILRRFLATNEQTRELVRQAGGVDVNRVRFKNPFVGLIRFTVGTGLEIIAKHERRHLLQGERIRRSPGFPS